MYIPVVASHGGAPIDRKRQTARVVVLFRSARKLPLPALRKNSHCGDVDDWIDKHYAADIGGLCERSGSESPTVMVTKIDGDDGIEEEVQEGDDKDPEVVDQQSLKLVRAVDPTP